MGEKRVDSGGKNTKKCFVLLKRLDEKLLGKYLRHDIKTASFLQNVKDGTINKGTKDTKRRKKSKGSSVKSESRRKKRKIVPLYYTDDKADENTSKCSLGGDCSSACSDSQTMNCLKPVEMVLKFERSEEGEKDEPAVEGSGDFSCGRSVDCSAVDSEIEIIREFPRSVPGDLNCKKVEPVCDAKCTGSESPELEDEYDSRDDDEDDRNTVIFEKDTDSEVVFEFEGRETNNAFSDKKITNRKKQRLVKFNRKSMTGRNLGKIFKSNNKIVEGGSTGQETAEKSANEIHDENYMEEICGSVRRLHDMYTVILLLQREMPKDNDLIIHFKRVINARKEIFHTEIRKARKIIMKFFEKVLLFYDYNIDKVALEIGKRIYLSPEEVIYILSLCVLSEGSYDSDRSRSGSAEKTEQPKSSSNSLRDVRKATPVKSCKSITAALEVVNAEVPNLVPPSGPVSSVASVASVSSVASVASVSSVASVASVASVGAMGFSRHPQVSREHLPSCSNYPVQQPRHRSHHWTQQDVENARINDSRMRQFEMNSFSQTNVRPPVMRQQFPMNQPPNIIPQYCNQNYYPYSPYSVVGQYRSNVPDAACPGAVLDKVYPRYSAVPNRVLESNKGSPLTEVQAAGLPRKSGFPSMEAFDCVLVNGQVIMTPRCEPQRRMGFTNSVAYSGEKSLPQRHEMTSRGIGTNPTAWKNPEVRPPQTLDPTIPQKLTMKNCKLQAGPILGNVRAPRECSRSESKDREHSNFRTYVCAQNGCKNPGVRICLFCQSVIYCSETCQLKHWNLKHKAECCQLQELRG